MMIKREEKRVKTKPKIRIETKSENESERVAGPGGGTRGDLATWRRSCESGP
jgi:hypothetical protein